MHFVVVVYKHVVHENEVNGSSMVGFPLLIADFERDMPGIEPALLDWYTSTLTTGLQEVLSVKYFLAFNLLTFGLESLASPYFVLPAV